MSIARVGRDARVRAALILALPVLFLLFLVLPGASARAQTAPGKASARAAAGETLSKSTDRRRCAVTSRVRGRAARLRAKRAHRRCLRRQAHTALNRRPKPKVKHPVAAPAAAAGGSPSWVGDFENGGLSQWDGQDGNRSLRDRYFRTVSSPAAPGSRFAFAATVDPQASSGDAGHRSLLYLYPADVASESKTGAYEGSERWYRTLVYFPSDFHPAQNTDWNWVAEWHNWPNGPCCANLAVTVDTDPDRGPGERLSLRAMGGGDRAHPMEGDLDANDNPAAHVDRYVGDKSLRRDHWYELVTHVKWSADPHQGLLEWWVDGRQIVSTQTSTLYWYADNNENIDGETPGPGQAYYMEGYYRPTKLTNGEPDTSSATVYHDGARIGPTRGSVGA
jgi:polysaccharide lyase-like protein